MSRALSLLLIYAVALLSGCATTATFEGMTPVSFENVKKHPNTVAVATKVMSGQEDMAGREQITEVEFQKALEEAITKSQTFKSIVQGKSADYLLTVSIFSADRPMMGFSFTAKIEAGWKLTRVDSDKVVWQETIKSEHTATTGDALGGHKRLRLATEGAARNNLSQGLAKISKLEL
jgi:hypothetical protein